MQANFVVVQTFLDIMAFGATLTNFVNILRSQVPWKWSITLYDNNKYTNWIDIYKNVTMQKCLQLWNILHIEFSFCCELQRINQSSPVFNAFATCHNTHIHNTFVQHHQTWTCTCLKKKLKSVDANFQAKVGIF